jgi:hypothetical protein
MHVCMHIPCTATTSDRVSHTHVDWLPRSDAVHVSEVVVVVVNSTQARIHVVIKLHLLCDDTLFPCKQTCILRDEQISSTY